MKFFAYFEILVMIYLSWDSEAVNRTLNVPPMYRVYKEYQKPQNEQNCELLKYRYDFLKTIVEAIKTVSTINIFPIKGSDPILFLKSMSEKVGYDIETTLNYVVLCRIRLFPTLISKIK